MAVWQFDFYIVDYSNSLLYDDNKSFDDNEDLLNWESEQTNKESIITLAKILPLEISWSKNTMQYGKIDGTCVEISSFDNAIFDIRIRLDIRSLSRELLNEIVSFIQSNRGSIVYNNKCYPAEEKILLDLIKESNAYKFSRNPERFLTNLNTQK